MKITRQPDIENFILDEIRAHFAKQDEERNKGLHLSDLLCPRQSYWKRVHPLPLTDKEIQYFLIGRGHEEALHICSGYEHGTQQEWEGILYTPDFYHNFPDESKTRRGYLAKPGEEAERYESYIAQVRGYCAVTGKNQAWLRVWSLMERQDDFTTAPEFAAYRVEFEELELMQERERLIILKGCLLEGLKQKNHQIIPQCPSWMCGRVQRTTRVPAYCETCKKDFARPEVHLKSKPEHKMRPAEYDYTFDKRCKWFNDCEPKLV